MGKVNIFFTIWNKKDGSELLQITGVCAFVRKSVIWDFLITLSLYLRNILMVSPSHFVLWSLHYVVCIYKDITNINFSSAALIVISHMVVLEPRAEKGLAMQYGYTSFLWCRLPLGMFQIQFCKGKHISGLGRGEVGWYIVVVVEKG